MGLRLLKGFVAFIALVSLACEQTSVAPAAADPVVDPRPAGSGKSPVAPRASGIVAPATVKAWPREQTWVYPQTATGPMHVVVSIPAGPPDRRYPVLVTMHGRGEALKGPARGARGWIDDYALGRALSRLLAPPLTKSDFLGFADADRIVRMNESLKLDPYHGLVIVMPYTPDRLRGDRPFEAARPLAQFIVDELLPRVYRETPALGTAAATGIDGVSLGGRAAIAVGLQRPTAFGVVAALQAAFDSEEAAQIAEQARRAMSRNSKLVLRLLTSDGDFFLESNRAISRELRARSVPHRLLVVNGPHDYDFNRGPGAFEMLLLHDRVLRGRPAP